MLSCQTVQFATGSAVPLTVSMNNARTQQDRGDLTHSKPFIHSFIFFTRHSTKSAQSFFTLFSLLSPLHNLTSLNALLLLLELNLLRLLVLV